VIHPVGKCQWEDVNWNDDGHHTCINMELRTYCRLLYPGMVTVGGQRQVARWLFESYIKMELGTYIIYA
jgi:hypothetical protein